MREILPENVYSEIEEHLLHRSVLAEDGWDSGEADEDTLTGHVGAILQTRWSPYKQFGQPGWRWRVLYKKFRGRGPGAIEKTIGADGIFQIEIVKQGYQEISSKGILFQAKKGDIRVSKTLTRQVEKMEDYAPGASAIFGYKENHFQSISSYEYLEELGTKIKFSRNKSIRMGEFLSKSFLGCEVGMNGLYYDGLRKRLVIPSIDEQFKIIQLDLGHRISIEIESYL